MKRMNPAVISPMPRREKDANTEMKGTPGDDLLDDPELRRQYLEAKRKEEERLAAKRKEGK